VISNAYGIHLVILISIMRNVLELDNIMGILVYGLYGDVWG
jgi:hypothetical protein